MSFEPKIVAFCCNWCSYAAADLNAVSRQCADHSGNVLRYGPSRICDGCFSAGS